MLPRFRSVLQLLEYYNCNAKCIQLLEAQRWRGKPICPHCKSDKPHYTIEKGARLKCANGKCGKRFNVLIGTIFENTKIELRYWFAAIYLISNHKKGISSYQLHRDLGVTQKTAWFMLHRVREMLNEDAGVLSNIVEADETFMGGRDGNKHVSKRSSQMPTKSLITSGKSQSLKTDNKTPVAGIVERNGKIVLKKLDNVGKSELSKFVIENVAKDTNIYTDEHRGYLPLSKLGFVHDTVKHSSNEYVRGAVHTNTIEGFWSIFKRGVYGIYHHISVPHLNSYCNEFAYRYNTRKMTDQDRFNHLLTHTNVRLKYEDLIARA